MCLSWNGRNLYVSSEERVFCGSSKCSLKTQRFHTRLLRVIATMELLHCAVLLAILINGEIIFFINSITLLDIVG